MNGNTEIQMRPCFNYIVQTTPRMTDKHNTTNDRAFEKWMNANQQDDDVLM